MKISKPTSEGTRPGDGGKDQTDEVVGANATRLGWKELLQRKFGSGHLKPRINVERV